jgi:type II secretory pathway pseudopilin PulG
VKRAYSMLELLVVIGVIVVIASILMPVFSQSKERAKQAVCISNLKQFHYALEMYRQDNEEYPVTVIDRGFLRYMGETILRCPVAIPREPFAGDYSYRGSPVPGVEQIDPQYNQRFLECREKRGGEFPLVWDDNHATKLQGVRSGGRFDFVLRANGNVQRLPHRLFLSGPCEPPVDFLNL